MNRLFFSVILCLGLSYQVAAQIYVSGTVYSDNDYNGMYTSGDQYLMNVSVAVINAATFTPVAFTSTDGGGFYNVNLISGTYYIEFSAPPETGCASFMYMNIGGDNISYMIPGGGTMQTPNFSVSGNFNAAAYPALSVPDSPTIQASNLSVSGLSSLQATINWSRGNGTDVLVMMKESVAITTPPENCNSYSANSVFGSGQFNGAYVVYNGTGTSVTVTNLRPETAYHVRLFEYKYVVSYGYLTTLVTINFTTPALTYPYAGTALMLNGINQYAGQIGDCSSSSSKLEFIPNTGIFTIEAWIKLTDPNSDAANTIIANTSSASEKGMLFAFDNRSSMGRDKQLFLGLYNGSGSPEIESVSSAGIITDTEWHHVAVAGNGNSVTFYVDGKAYAGSGTIGTKATGASTRQAHIGACPTGTTAQCVNYTANAHYFNGQLDELKLWSTSRNLSQIRFNLHLTLYGYETGLYSYWQFEDDGSSTLAEPISSKTAVNGGTLNNSGIFVVSEAPVARGTSAMVTMTTLGNPIVNDVALSFPHWATTPPNGDVYIFKLNTLPVSLPSGFTPIGNTYWIINNYGTNAVFSEINLAFSNGGTVTAAHVATPSTLNLYKRASNASGDTWVNYGGAVLAYQVPPRVHFNYTLNITSFSQFLIGLANPLPVNFISLIPEFTGDDLGVKWVTSNEKNNKGFFIELKSKKQNAFFSYGFVNGNNGSDVNEYYTILKSLPEDFYYCRIKQSDNDGTTTYSDIVAVEKKNTGVVLTHPYPNPTSGEITFNVSSQNETSVYIFLYNSDGGLLESLEANLEEENTVEVKMDIQNYESQVFILKIQGENLDKSFLLSK